MTDLTEDDKRRLRETVRYEPDTGFLFWRRRPRSHFTDSNRMNAFNNRFAGKRITSRASGYIVFETMGFSLRGHRVAWFLQTGDFPTGFIDHINHDRSDNRWVNIRQVTPAENTRNTNLYRTNSSGISGVNWSGRDRRWHASISIKGKNTYIGSFEYFWDACCARKSVEAQLGFHKNHGKNVVDIK